MKIRTSKRLYRIEPCLDGRGENSHWQATYQNINPKTGNAWQAVRYVGGWDGHWICKAWGSGLEVRPGPMPKPFNFEGIKSAGQCFLKESSAVKAIHGFDPDTINAPHI